MKNLVHPKISKILFKTMKITESNIESLAIELLEAQGYQYLYAPDKAHDSDSPERESYVSYI